MHLALSPYGVVHFILTPGQRQDVRVFNELSKQWPWHTITHVIADKGYDSEELR